MKVYDNIEYFNDNALKLIPGTFRYVKILMRPKKDSLESDLLKIFGSHRDKVIWSGFVKDDESYKRTTDYGKFLCDHLPSSRMYITSNIKSINKSIKLLLEKSTELISTRYLNDNDIRVKLNSEIGSGCDNAAIKVLSSITPSIGSSDGSDYSRKTNYLMLDFDIIENGIDKKGLKGYIDAFIKRNKFKGVVYYETPKGYHLFLHYGLLNPYSLLYDEYEKLNEALKDKAEITEKKNAMALLYSRENTI